MVRCGKSLMLICMEFLVITQMPKVIKNLGTRAENSAYYMGAKSSNEAKSNI